MLTEKQLQEANRLIKKRDMLTHVLRGLDSPNVETTVGLVGAFHGHNSSSVKLGDDAEWFHRELRDVEKQLKQQLRGKLMEKHGEITAELAKLVSS